MNRFTSSTIGKKIVVAVTGLIMFGFIVGHLLGNLQVFQGPEKLNNYAHFLKHATALLWGTRVALLASVLLHIVCTVQLNRRNRASRPIGYAQHQMIQASRPSLFMIWSGVFLAVYIVYHLLHLTVGSVHPNFDELDVYRNIVNGFQVWYVSLFYILAMVSLGFHLNHGVFSVFQTLGLNHPRYNCWRRLFATGASVLITLGYISIPVAVVVGVVK